MRGARRNIELKRRAGQSGIRVPQPDVQQVVSSAADRVLYCMRLDEPPSCVYRPWLDASIPKGDTSPVRLELMRATGAELRKALLLDSVASPL